METPWVYRVLLLYPDSRRLGVETWYQTEWPDAGKLLTPSGSKNGEAWFGSSFLATKEHVARWLEIFAQNVGQPAPAGLLEMPREMQRVVMQQMALAAQASIGIVFRAAFNDLGESIDQHAIMNELGIERLTGDE